MPPLAKNQLHEQAESPQYGHWLCFYGQMWFVVERNQGQTFPVVGGGLGRGLAAFTLEAIVVYGMSKPSVHRSIHHKHSLEKQSKYLYTTASNLLSIPFFFRPEERPKRPAWESHLHPTLASSHHLQQLAPGNKHTHAPSSPLPPVCTNLLQCLCCTR